MNPWDVRIGPAGISAVLYKDLHLVPASCVLLPETAAAPQSNQATCAGP